MVVVSVGVAVASGTLEATGEAVLARAQSAVMNVMLPLAGMISLWLGVMRLVEVSGLIHKIARGINPVLGFLFPDLPKGHPALGTIAMNLGANMLGAGNAATPLGLRAMDQLNQLNPHPGTASNAMVMLLVLNTSGITLIPASTIALLHKQGAQEPTSIIGPAILASLLATICAVAICFFLQRLPRFRDMAPALSPGSPLPPAAIAPAPASTPAAPARMTAWKHLLLWSMGAAFVAMTVWYTAGPDSLLRVQASIFHSIHGADPGASGWFGPVPAEFYQRLMKVVSVAVLPGSLAFFVLYAALAGVKVYEELVEGAKEGVATTIRVIPYVVAMLVAVGMFTESGALGLLQKGIGPVLAWLGFPFEVLPISIVRSLSGGAATAMLAEVAGSHGADSLVTRIAATINGSSETTFYVAALYFGAVGVSRMRHAIPAGLAADACAVVLSILFCRLLLG